jgi:hypothetical protein
MGDELANFKTIRLCSISTALSNTIAVALNSNSRRPPWGDLGAGPSKWAPWRPFMQ